MKHPWASRTLLYGPYLTLVLTEKQFHAACADLGLKGLEWHTTNHGSTHQLTAPGDKHACIVAIRDYESRSVNSVLALIVHEAVHVWQYAKEIMGETNPGKEIEAYAIQNITQVLFDMYDELIKEV